jgi:hypothetical protein
MPARAALALLAALAALAAAPPAAAARAGAGAGRHPEVKGDAECATCHRTDTPQSFEAWERSPHGAALVKCVVCHGSPGAAFRAKPAATTCQGCHAVQVASVARRPVKDCFACHAPHALTTNPHR